MPLLLPTVEVEKNDEVVEEEEKRMKGMEGRNEERKEEEDKEKQNGEKMGDEKEVEKEVLDEGELDIPREFFSEIQVTNREEPSDSEDGEAGQDFLEGMVGGYYEINTEFLHTPLYKLTPLSCAVMAGRVQVRNKFTMAA